MTHGFRARENAADASMKRLASELPAALAKATGSAWSVSASHERGLTLKREGSYSLSLHLSTYPKPRLGVSMASPQAATGETIHWSYVAEWDAVKLERAPRPEIHVSPDKSADQIARHVARRLLPALDAAWPRFVAYLEKERATLDAYGAALDRLRAMGAEVFEGRNGSSQSATAYFNRLKPGSVSVVVERGGSVKIAESLSMDQAEPVLRAILAVRG